MTNQHSAAPDAEAVYYANMFKEKGMCTPISASAREVSECISRLYPEKKFRIKIDARGREQILAIY